MNIARRMGQIDWRYSVAELWADGVVHVLGVLLAIAGTIAFVVAMGGETHLPDFVAACIYLGTLVLSIAASAAYNIWPVSRTKWLLRRLDHSAIYLLIAGTYTPLMVSIGSGWMLAFVWCVAGLGVVLKLVRPGRFDRLSIGLYIALGWSGIVLYDRLVDRLPDGVLTLIVCGGIVYSLGVVFHVWERLRYQNVIWHGFVLAAASIHFAAVWRLTDAASGLAAMTSAG